MVIPLLEQLNKQWKKKHEKEIIRSVKCRKIIKLCLGLSVSMSRGVQNLGEKKKIRKETRFAPDMHKIPCDLTCCLNHDLLPLPGERS